MIRRLVLVAAIALVAAPSAAAHAILTGTSPADGSVLASSPGVVRVTFDSTVRPGPNNAAVRADRRDVLAGAPRVEAGHTLLIPLRPHLEPGDYTVRWSVVSDDGHEEEGLIAFAVGAGSPKPVPVLAVHGFETWQRVVMRALFFAGVLGAAGSAAFALLVLMPLGLEAALRRPHAHLLFAFFLAAFCGADALAHTANAAGTRFERLMIVAAAAAGIGAVAAALTPVSGLLRYPARLAACVLFACPTFAGHALDAGQPHIVAPIADLFHLGGAAVWVGGVACLCALLGRVPHAERPRALSRFSSIAVPAVALVAVAGAARALTELASIGQLWSTGYGRALLAKSALFVSVLGVAALGRLRVATGPGSASDLQADAMERAGNTVRARRVLALELALLAGIVIALGALSDLRPGVSARAPGAGGAYPASGSSRASSR